jgi:GATA-binding protein, other eukaryote
VKKEPRDFGIARRSSVSSTSSSVHSSNGATSDWDDNGALRVAMYRRRTVD